MDQYCNNDGRIYFEEVYANSLRKLIQKAEQNKWEGNRTENRTVSMHASFLLPFIDDNFPLIKCKSVGVKLQLIETLWILLGRNDLKWLNNRGLHYWDDWKITRNGKFPAYEYFDPVDYDISGVIDTVGYSYGTAARTFTGVYESVDNWTNVIKTALESPISRRLVFSLWDPNNVDKTPLPPCAVMYIFKTTEIRTAETGIMYNVDVDAIMRSNDAFLGAPYDFLMASWILKLFCLELNTLKGRETFIPRHVYYTASNYHLYENQIEPAKEYISRVDEDLKLSDSIIRVGEVDAYVNFEDKDKKFLDLTNIKSFMQALSDYCDERKFDNVIIEKNYSNNYGKIKCDVTI
jgi:thymidylate synthase